jgi:hypothetical protein
MHNEVKTLYSLYKESASINNTTRNTDSYLYSPQEYSSSRSEQEEQKNIIKQKLEYCSKLSSSGQKEDYRKIFFTLREVDKILQDKIQ